MKDNFLRLGDTGLVEVGPVSVRENAEDQVRETSALPRVVPRQVLDQREPRPQEVKMWRRPGSRVFRGVRIACGRDGADAVGIEPTVAPAGQQERAANEEPHTLLIEKAE